MTEPMMCRELVELVTERLEGALTADDRVRFEEHLAVCPACVTYVAQIETTVQLSTLVGGTGLPDDDRAALDVLLDSLRRETGPGA